MEGKIKFTILFIFLLGVTVCNSEEPNLFCNGDFQSYRFSTAKPFYYYEYTYKSFWIRHDPCWYAKRIIPNDIPIKIQQVFSNPQKIQMTSKMISPSSSSPSFKQYVCQDRNLQINRYYNYSYQIILHPLIYKVTADAYINSNKVRSLPIVLTQTTLLNQTFYATDIYNAFCAGVSKIGWKTRNYSRAGLSVYFDNFQLKKIPQTVYSLPFQAKFIQVQNKIILTADASNLNSNLIDYVFHNSVVTINGKQVSFVQYLLIEGKYIQGTIKINYYKVIFSMNITVKTMLTNSSTQIAFDTPVWQTPPTKIFYPLEQSQVDSLNSMSSFGQSYFSIILKIYNQFKIFGCSYFFVNFFNSIGTFTLYNYLNLSAQTTLSYLGISRISSQFLSNNQNIFEFFKSMMYKLRINLSRDFYNLEGTTESKTDKIPPKMNGFYWFGTYGIYANFLKNNIIDILLYVFLLLKVAVVVYLLKKIPFLAAKFPKITKLSICKLFLFQTICCSSFMMISAFSNLVFAGLTNNNQKANTVIQIWVVVIIIAVPFIYYLIVEYQFNKMTSALPQKQIKTKKYLNIKSLVKWETNFQMCQFFLYLSMPMLVLIQSIVGALIGLSAFLIILIICFIKGYSYFSGGFKFIKGIFLCIFIIHHFAYTVLGIASVSLNNNIEISESIAYWCKSLGSLTIVTTIMLGFIMMIEMLSYAYSLIIKPLFGVVYQKVGNYCNQWRYRNAVNNVKGQKNIFDQQQQHENPTVKYINQYAKTPHRKNSDLQELKGSQKRNNKSSY